MSDDRLQDQSVESGNTAGAEDEVQIEAVLLTPGDTPPPMSDIE